VVQLKRENAVDLGQRIPLGAGLMATWPQWQMAAYRARPADGALNLSAGSVAAVACRFFMRTAPRHFVYRVVVPVDFSEEEFSCCVRWRTSLPARSQRSFFPKTQEQAITDGLTGVKTHRFS